MRWQPRSASGAAPAATSARPIAVNRSLDDTIANLNGRILQTTMIDPGDDLWGQIVVIHADFNNQDHEFRYTVKAVRRLAPAFWGSDS